MYERYIKRLLDVVISLAALLVLSPLLLALAVLIKLDSPGPVIFSQKRFGKNRTFFQIYKFRSMRADTP
ncbi:MAG: sugar transferase, partial [Clostridia bacterium]|nr:sugar transferase [Clostridia bacterium]